MGIYSLEEGATLRNGRNWHKMCLSKIMNDSLVYFGNNPIAMVMKVLREIDAMKDEIGIPIKTFIRAPARLMRRGVSILVTLEQEGRDELVPLRVEDESVLYYRFCSHEEMAVWHGKYIHPIRPESCTTIQDLVKMVIKCLKTAFNRFMRNLQKNACKLNKQVRIARMKEPYRRHEIARMCH